MSEVYVEGQNKGGLTCKQLRDLADQCFTKKSSLTTLHQEVAENFYPERADFTVRRYLGDDFAGNLSTSYPILCRRDLSDQIGTMLRNTTKPWFHMIVRDPHMMADHYTKQWLEWAEGTMRRAMYAKATQFNKATAQGDADFATFGQCVIRVRLNRDGDDLLYTCFHLRDMAWLEDEDGKLCAYFRRSKMTYRDMVRLFDRPSQGKSVHANIKTKADKHPTEECDCYHFMVAADMYEGPANKKGADRFPWRSVTYDCQNQHAMEEVAQRRKEYVVPRWLTVSGSQYAYSPAVTAALPEARLLQAMTYTLLEAGEKVVLPPYLATEQVLRSDLDLQAGGVSWVEREYDQRTGDPLKPMHIDAKGMPLSIDMQKDSRVLLMHCFYLNKLTLPQRGPEMTAYEVGQRIQQYVRDALPLFEPMEPEYNGEICEETFGTMLDYGGFGAVADMPPSFRAGGDLIDWRFASPLHDQIEMMKGQKFVEMGQLLNQAVAMDKRAYAITDTLAAFRDALEGVGTPMTWIRSESAAQQMIETDAEKQQAAEMMASVQNMAPAIKDIASAQQMGAEQAVA